jgi:hypothetical protein
MKIIPVLLLCGCIPSTVAVDTKSPQTHVIQAVYSPYDKTAKNTQCMAQPIPPLNLTNHNMGLYIAALIIAGQDCRDKKN